MALETEEIGSVDLSEFAAGQWVGYATCFLNMLPPLSDDTGDHTADDPEVMGFRNLIQINRELDRGDAASPYVVENASTLRESAIALITSKEAGSTDDGRRSRNEWTSLEAKLDRIADILDRQRHEVLNSAASSEVAAADQYPVPLFSRAAEEYLAARIKAAGGVETGDIHSIRGRVALFIELHGDRKLDEYTTVDLEDFFSTLQFWPPKPDQFEELAGKNARQILEMNKKHKYGVMALNTAKGHYIADVKAIAKHAAAACRIISPFQGARLMTPAMLAKPKRHKCPNIKLLVKAVRAGVASGEFHKAVILLLAYFTGRRVGLLARLRREDIYRVGEFVVMRGQQFHEDDDGGLGLNGFKTEQSLDGFILHRFFDDIGLVDWIMQKPGFLFERMNGCLDPEDAMQKAANRLLHDAKTGGTLHGLRGYTATMMRRAGVSDYSRRVQSGHAPIDEHEEYGELPMDPSDAPLLANLPLPPGLCVDDFAGLDFEAMATVSRIR